MIIVAFPYKKQEEPYLNDSMKKYFKGIDKKNTEIKWIFLKIYAMLNVNQFKISNK